MWLDIYYRFITLLWEKFTHNLIFVKLIVKYRLILLKLDILINNYRRVIFWVNFLWNYKNLINSFSQFYAKIISKCAFKPLKQFFICNYWSNYLFRFNNINMFKILSFVEKTKRKFFTIEILNDFIVFCKIFLFCRTAALIGNLRWS